MAAAGGGKSLEQTPTWAVAVVCFILLFISIIIEYIIHLIGQWLKKRHKRALFEALEKIKSELMLLGFISLLLTVGQGPISDICIPEHVAATWHPCTKEKEAKMNEDMEKSVEHLANNGRRLLHLNGTGGSFRGGFWPRLVEPTSVLLRAKMRSWKTWEKETKTAEYQFSHDPERFRFARDTSFGRRHLNFWTKNSALMWIVCFFRQFVRSVPKVDYLTLRHGFIMAHLAPQSHTQFDFQKYINRSLEEDFKVVVGISPPIWFFAVLFLLSNTHGWRAYLWLPFIPLIILLLIGTKLQVIITKMALRIQERGEVVKGVPVVEPGDDLFWFNRPRLILYLINFVLFQNAFQVGFFAWTWYEFGLNSCFHEHVEDVVIRISMGYVTLPLYALVTQMGSTMKPTIFNERVAAALRNWYHTARKHIKHNRGSITPMSSRPTTPTHHMSPVHLLRHYKSEVDSFHNSPRRSPRELDRWDNDSPSPSRHADGSSSSQPHVEMGSYDKDPIESGLTEVNPVRPSRTRTQHEIDIGHKDFSFDRIE
ncbi:MLO-like protein 6, partial [Cucurbita argyrosperma subsp. sororia]